MLIDMAQRRMLPAQIRFTYGLNPVWLRGDGPFWGSRESRLVCDRYGRRIHRVLSR